MWQWFIRNFLVWKWMEKSNLIPMDRDHLADIAKNNAEWHRIKFKETNDRNHLGQWVAYRRMYKRLRSYNVLN